MHPHHIEMLQSRSPVSFADWLTMDSLSRIRTIRVLAIQCLSSDEFDEALAETFPDIDFVTSWTELDKPFQNIEEADMVNRLLPGIYSLSGAQVNVISWSPRPMA